MNTAVKFRGHKININIEGEGEPLIFLHGWPTNLRLWDNQVRHFSKQYKVITPDWLGFGKSDKPNLHRYTFTAQKEILDIIIRSLTKEQDIIKIVAHDIGGPPAILWSYENKYRVDKLILLNTILYPFSTKLDKISHFLFKIPVINDFAVSNFWLKNLMSSLTRSVDSTLQDQIKNIINHHSDYSKSLKLKTILEPMEEGRRNELQEVEHKLQEMKNKLQLIVAREDPLCFEHMQMFIKRNPKISVQLIENCGHYMSIDRPAEVNDALRKILN